MVADGRAHLKATLEDARREWAALRPSWHVALDRAAPWRGVLLATATGLALRQLIGPVIRWGSPIDDESQMRVAAALLSGQWLGEWGNQPTAPMTLAKGAGYPLFLAAINGTGLSPHMAAYLLYLGGALLLVLALRPVVGWAWATGLYAALALSPHAMSVSFSRPYRDQLVAALALLSFGSAVRLARCLAVPGSWTGRIRATAVVCTVLSAASLAWLSITRADTVWVFAACLLALGVTLVPSARALERRGWLRIGASALVVVAAVVACSSAIAAKNDAQYGVRLTDDYSQGAFADALRSWSSVEPSSAKPFTLVTQGQRRAVYAVSPTARQVESRLEDPKNPWVTFGCPKEPQTPPCVEFGPFVGWALRDAVYGAGYTTASSFQDYFARLTREIEQACETDSVSCGDRGMSADVPALERLSWRACSASAVNLINAALSFEDNLESPQAPVPQDQQLVETWERTIPDVSNLVALLDAGQSPDVIAQQSTVNLLKRLYSTLTILAVPLLLIALVTGALWRSYAGRLALAAFAGWAGVNLIVALVLGATNRQLPAVPSYTVPGQAFLLTGLLLSVFACAQRWWPGQKRRPSEADDAPTTR